MSATLDWYTYRKATPVNRTFGYFTLPAFSVSGVTWKDASEIVRQYNYTASKNFVLRRRPAKPEDANYALAIRYRRGDTVYRYLLWTDDGLILPDVPVYSGQVIKKNFCLEIWSLDGETTAVQDEAIALQTGIMQVVTDFTATPADYEDSTGAAASTLENTTTPASSPVLTDLAGWFRAGSTDVSLDGSENVIQWNDKSGNGNHLGQGDPAFRPAYFSNGFGSRDMPYILFDSVDHGLGLNTLAVNVPFGHVYMVFSQHNWTNGKSLLLSDITVFSQLGSSGDINAFTDSLSATVNFPVAALEATEDNPRIMEYYAVSQGGLGTIPVFRHNSLFKTVDSAEFPGEVELNAGSALVVGSLGGISARFSVAEILIYSTQRTGEQHEAIMQYLANRYAVAMNLPISFDSGSQWLDNE